MSLAIPLTTATTSYVQFGGGGLYVNGGYLFVGNGPVDVILIKGTNTGITFDEGPYTLSAGYYPIQPSDPNGVCVIGIQVRAGGGTVSTPTAQVYYGALFDSAGIGAGIPYTGTLSNTGNISGANMITGQVSSTGTITGGTGFTVTAAGGGVYNITFTAPFAAPPIIVGDTTSAGNPITFQASAVTASGFTAILYTAAGSGTNGQFNFAAIGVQ